MAWTINNGQLYFNTKLYTGTGSTLNITGVGFQPDLVWTKLRDSTAEGVMDHALVDSVRGVTKTLRSNTSAAEGTEANSLTAFGSDGYTVGNNGKFNYSSSDIYVSWNWLASNTTASNTDGSISSTVSANTTSGFSVVSYTGTGANATVGHGLGAEAKFIIFKDRSTTKDWFVYHQSISPATGGKLNLTVNPGADSSYFQNTAPTSSVFSIGNANTVNPSSNEMIAYCFAEKQGYSKFGSYTGNGNADGTFVYTGFKPAWFMVKRTDSADGWGMFDNKRDPHNQVGGRFWGDTSDAESTGQAMDFLSNGFKIRAANAYWNASGGNYIFMCFAENPFTSSTGTPVTAR